MRVRVEPESNYKGIHIGGMTLRLQLDLSKPITELTYPEFYDIKITDACDGKCPYCYQNSGGGSHAKYAIEKIWNLFATMTENQRPFQIAYGGGEPTLHPDFVEILKTTRELGIAPNYTTNGMTMDNDLVAATLEYCDGVAVSCHPHLDRRWTFAVALLADRGMKPNLHVIISDTQSVRRAMGIYRTWKDLIRKMVLLPYEPVGRATPLEQSAAENARKWLWVYLKGLTPDEVSQIAFGAGFYEDLKEQPWLQTSLYEPELMSKYIDLCTMMTYPSSFHTQEGRWLPDWMWL